MKSYNVTYKSSVFHDNDINYNLAGAIKVTVPEPREAISKAVRTLKARISEIDSACTVSIIDCPGCVDVFRDMPDKKDAHILRLSDFKFESVVE